MSSTIESIIKKHLRLPNDFPLSMIFYKDAIGATEIKIIFLQKSVGDILVSLKPGATSMKYAQAFLRQLSWELCDTNSPMANPIQLGKFRHHHPLANSSNLMLQYALSLVHSIEPITSRFTALLDIPIDGLDLIALAYSGLSKISQFGTGLQKLLPLLQLFRPYPCKALEKFIKIFDKRQPSLTLTRKLLVCIIRVYN
jgi:hypothetical protein